MTRGVAPRTIAACAGLVVAVAGIAGFWWGRSDGSRVHWTTGTVTAAEGRATIETGDFTYGIVGSVLYWIDDGGSLNQLSYPECLTPGEHTNVRFAWVTANDPELGSSRAVVAVDCRR